MTLVRAYQFEIRPPPEETAGQCLEAVRDKVQAWAELSARRRGVNGLHFGLNGSTADLNRGHQVFSDEQDFGSHRLATLEWRFPEDFRARMEIPRAPGGPPQPISDTDLPKPKISW